jgi:hypothetical protein
MNETPDERYLAGSFDSMTGVIRVVYRAARGRGAVNLATARGRAAFARAIQPRPGRGFRLPGAGRGR